MTTALPVYDSAQGRRPIISELRNFWDYRGLVRLLAARDLTVRYKRSVLGVWWTLLNPMLNVLVFWIVFQNIFHREGDGSVPFVVYVTSGILLATFFSQGVVASGSAIVGARNILDKVHVPPEVFSLASALAAGVNFMVSLLALVVIQVVSGVGIPWTFALIPLSAVAMLMLVTGLGLATASAAVQFYDIFDLVRVITLIITYMSASFYPIDILDDRWRIVIEMNPVYHHLSVFRSLSYGAPLSGVSVAVTVISSFGLLALGVWIFSRSWKNVVVTL